jgi:hypothetical protein
VQALAKERAPRLKVVCAAELYDDMLRQVRMWTRLGYSASQVQQEVDSRFDAILDTAAYARLLATRR